MQARWRSSYKSLILMILLSASGRTYARSDTAATSLNATDLTALDIRQVHGDISITGSKQQALTVSSTAKAGDCPAPLLKRHGKGASLVVAPPPGGRCQLDLHVSVPDHLQLSIEMGRGNLKLERLSGRVAFRIGVGNALLEDLAGAKIEGRSASGNIKAVGHAAAYTAVVLGAGEADIAFQTPKPKGQLHLHIGTGNARVSLPPEVQVSTKFKADVGSLTDEFAGKATGHKHPFFIKGTAGFGNLLVRKI